MAFDDGVRAERAADGVPARNRGRGVASEVALVRRESPHAGLRHLGLAHALVEELPCTLATLEAGVLTEHRCSLIATVFGALSPEDRAAADAELCGDHERIVSWGNRRVDAEARRIAYRLDPVGFTERAVRAQADRYVGLRPAPDTMAWFSALLPMAQGVAVKVALGRLADAAITSGRAGLPSAEGSDEPRTRAQLMADALVERVTGLDLGMGRAEASAAAAPDRTVWASPTGAGSPGSPGSPGSWGSSDAAVVPVRVNLTISDETLLTGGADPAWVGGYGPIPAQMARDWVVEASEQARAELRRLYTSPVTGALVAMDSSARLFPKALAELVALRDQTCRTPWCDAPIRHTDHVVSRARGGPTLILNAQGLCVRCTLEKEAERWQARPQEGPPGAPHEVVTTTSHGLCVRSRAPALPRPTTRPARLACTRRGTRRHGPTGPRFDVFHGGVTVAFDAACGLAS